MRLGKLKEATQTAAVGTLHDSLFDVAYVALLQGGIAETIEVGEGIYYDLDSFGEVLGAEIFDYSRYENCEGKPRSIFKRLPIPTF